MRVQIITNNSIYTRGNGQGNGVNFSRVHADKGMPKFEGRIPKVSSGQSSTLCSELKTLATNIYDSFVKSYDKSEIKRLIINPITNKINSKSPQLAQAAKGAVIFTAGAGAVQYTSKKLFGKEE